ncbi:MAG: hypothetical protein OXG60_11730 [Chloroflexi bacterium]|nr:hypothetical protein [Chloroflexota bacterium]
MKANWMAAILILFLSACVPIQPEEFRISPIETKASLSDLADFFAKSEEYDDESEYMDLLVEFYECVSPATWGLELTDQQNIAMSIWMIGIMMSVASLERQEAFESGKIDQYHEEGFEGAGERPLNQMLLWAVEYCKE